MTKSFNKKALGAFWKLRSVVLITATLTMCFTACKQTGGGGGKPTPTPVPKPKHVIIFSVDSTSPNGTGGTLTAKIDGAEPQAQPATSPITVEEGKTVTFTAKANSGYRVKGWTLDGKPVAEAGTKTEYKLTVTKAATVKVSFEAIPKYAITFGLDCPESRGFLTAKVGEKSISSGEKIEEGKEVTFTAKANAGYELKGWTLDGNAVNGTEKTYTFTVTKACKVFVIFDFIILPKYKVTLTQTEGGKVAADPALSPDGLVEEGTYVHLVATPNAGYNISEWQILPTSAIYSGAKKGNVGAILKVMSNVTVSVNFELIPIKPPAKIILTLAKQRDITVRIDAGENASIKVEGCTETTLERKKRTTLHAKGTTVTLIGEITSLDCHENELIALNVRDCSTLDSLDCSSNKLTELDASGLTSLFDLVCGENNLTALNVQGCTILKQLDCSANKLDGQAMTKILNALPSHNEGDGAYAILYTERSGFDENNCKDFSQSEDLKKAFDEAKKRHWKLQKYSPSDIADL